MPLHGSQSDPIAVRVCLEPRYGYGASTARHGLPRCGDGDRAGRLPRTNVSHRPLVACWRSYSNARVSA